MGRIQESLQCKTLHILIENYDEKNKVIRGHSENYIEVSLNGTKDQINTIIEVKYHNNQM
ncbi:hypothetical protein SDC9_193612 [bioreactor metagenome]|uniref:Uncharacterized protein n=1 Tax=bioreactor metagenome TaxID=1076179 RepID=A0A645IF83_9ZZZZ